MNIKIKIVVIFALIFCFTISAQAINVGGIIKTDTTWFSSKSPYIITSTIQISKDITLTIEPGTEIKSTNGFIQVWGNLIAVGTEEDNIIFKAIDITPQDTGSIQIEYSEFFNGSPCYSSGNISYIGFILKNSNLYDIEALYLRYNCIVENNSFFYRADSGGYSGGVRVYPNAVIKNNVFYNAQINFAYQLEVENNLFYQCQIHLTDTLDSLKNNSIYIQPGIPSIYGRGQTDIEIIDISNNYWNIQDKKILDEIIIDSNDDLNNQAFVKYTPLLTEPHPDTPLYVDNDDDGFTVDQGDCNDNDPTIYPGAIEICGDGIDQDCDGSDLACVTDPNDTDNDGDGFTENQGDCNDNDPTIYPGAIEICGDGIDQDCNGSDLACVTDPNAPIANAGAEQTVHSGDIVTLDGSGSADLDGTIASYLWVQIDGPTVALSQKNIMKPTFTAPSVSELTKLTFQLTVEDNEGMISTDSVDIIVNKDSSAGGGGGGGCFVSSIF